MTKILSMFSTEVDDKGSFNV